MKVAMWMTAWAAAIALGGMAHAEVTAAGITAAEYPDADTVTIDDREVVEYFPDGTYKSVEESWTKALTEAGRRELSVTGIGFSRRYGEAKIAEVAIISGDGTRRKLDLAGQIRESTDNSSVSANIYDPLDRRIVCHVPGVKVGDTVYVRRERSTFAARCQDQWSTLSCLEGFSPVLRSSLTVKSPRERPIRRYAVRHPLGNVRCTAVTNADGSAVWEWCATNSPQAFPEPAMPSAYKQLQHVIVSTASDWRELSRWYWNLCAPHLAKTNAAMAAKIEGIGEAVKKAGGDRAALMKAVFKFVSQEVRYMGLTMEDKSPGYAPHDVDITFGKRYGVCRDKAGLLAAMLRLAGFDAYPVLIMAGSSKMDAEVPSPYFNHAIVAVDTAGDAESGGSPLSATCSTGSRYVLLDPTAESTRDLLPSYESDCSYLVARPEGETLQTTPMPSADANLLKIASVAELAEDGSMLVDGELAFGGLNDTIFRQHFLRMKPTGRRQFFEGIVSRTYPGAQLLKFEIAPADLRDVTRPLSAKLSAKVPEALLRGESELRLATGWFSQCLGIANMLVEGKTALEKRRFPLRLSSTAGVEETLQISLGEALGPVRSIPARLDIAGPYEYHFDAAVTNGAYLLSRTLKVNSLEFTPAGYLDLRERIKSVEAHERKASTFAKNRFASADVHYLLRERTVDFADDRSWTVTNTAVRRILTYDGKKGNSEMAFDYNPLFERVRVLRATVTDPSGNTVAAGEREITELDCGWAAAAPRYPASKRVVVTLPSVEIGSVITTVCERVVRNSPAAFRERDFLDTVEPTDELAYRVGGEAHRIANPERVPIERSQPAARFWRRNFVVDRGTLPATCEFLRRAAAVGKLDPSVLHLSAATPPSPKEIRDWMVKHVRVVGPSLYEVPLERQLTDPAAVVRERYATRLDFIRTLCALLKGAGHRADVVFASALRGDDERYPLAYAMAVCRSEGRFLGLENEYTPLAATSLDGCWYLDPATGREDVIRAEDGMRERDETVNTITVRANGAVDWDVEMLRRGASVGRFRKLYEEMLPEERDRHYQTIVGNLAQAASATSELVTDTKAYPARMAFSCFIPDYAVVDGDTVSLEVPGVSAGFGLSADVRRSPVGIGRADPESETWRIVLPAGYTNVERLPEAMTVHDPVDPAKVWTKTGVTSRVEGDHLVVTVVKTTFRRERATVASEYFPMLRDWTRRGTAPSSRTVTVRR